MVATFIFLDFSSTNRAEADAAMLSHPTFNLFIHVLFACRASMPLIATLEANFSRADRTLQLCYFQVFTPHGPAAAGLSTPAD